MSEVFKDYKFTILNWEVNNDTSINILDIVKSLIS